MRREPPDPDIGINYAVNASVNKRACQPAGIFIRYSNGPFVSRKNGSGLNLK